jgi:hypothetical protein
MSVIELVKEKMKEIIPDLPQNWADQIALRMGIRPDVVRNYAYGRRGVRNKYKALEILQNMLDLHKEFKKEIEELVK